jgi:hypothetical protein
MGPLRALCQTPFVWRCARGPQPATPDMAQRMISLPPKNKFSVLRIYCLQQPNTVCTWIHKVQFRCPLSHDADITLLPSAFLYGPLKGPMHFGVR